MDQLGSYRLRKRLAVGGMGEVYLGEKIGPEGFVKPVVLKCVLPQLAKDRAFVQLFLDEARLAALLNHPNIAQVYDFGLVDDTNYIAMEYVPGYTVDDIRRKLGSIDQFMPLQHIACIASQACQGLHYAHTLSDARGEGLGLVHRDVSPHNLMVSVDGTVKIVDFGIAKARAGLTRVQAKGAVGKFGYMSPEQSRGDSVDARSDIFSLGICLWELITNERLHDPNIDRAPSYSPTKPIKPVETHRTEVPRQFTQILETALSIQSVDRFPNCQEMHLALERFQAAMTHYAGQAALANYIKDLVEGRVENPAEDDHGHVVRPVSNSKSRGTTPARERENMDAAQKYEEVFGVTMESKRSRPKNRAVPKSWQTSDIPSQPPEIEPEPAEEVELELEDIDRRRPAYSSPSVHRSAPARPQRRAPTKKSSAPLMLLLSVVLLLVVGAGAYLMRDQITNFLGPKPPPPTAKLMSMYRIETTPPGATVLIDGERAKGVTPVEVELIPDVDYTVIIEKDHYATMQRKISAQIKRDVQIVGVDLEAAASLTIRTTPPGASVSVDGRNIDGRVTTMILNDVPAGRPFKVRAFKKGLPARTRTVKLAKGKRKLIHIDLER